MTRGSGVRLAEVDDAPVLASLLADFDAEFDSPCDPVPVLERRFARLLGLEAAYAVLAVEEGSGDSGSVRSRPTGFGLVTLRPAIWFDGPVATLDELYVVPDLRGRGTGTALMGLVRQEARARGCPEVHINVDEVDAGARRFYERHGFVNVEDPDDGRMLCYVGPA